MKNGTIQDGNGVNRGNHGVFTPGAGSTLTMDGITMTSTGTPILPNGNTAKVEVTNSSLVSTAYYVIATNANKVNGELEYGSGFTIDLSDSSFTVSNGEKDNCAVLINVPCTLNMSNCTVSAQRQGLIVRAGTANVSDSTISVSGDFDELSKNYTTNAWKSGNEVPAAAVVVGNYVNGKANSYEADAVLNLTNSTVENSAENGRAIYADSNDTYKSTVTVTGADSNVKGTVTSGQHDANKTNESEKKTEINLEDGTYDDENALENLTDVPQATVTDSDGNTTKVVGEDTIEAAAQNKNNTVSVTSIPADSTLELTGVRGTVKNDTKDSDDGKTKNGALQVNGVTVAQGSSYAPSYSGGSSAGTEETGFTDVPSDAWYKNAVDWAVQHNVTSGKTTTTFAPKEECSRAEMVTFLYNLADKPAVTGTSKFTDVKADTWYTDAVLWAEQNNVAAGKTDTTFAPDDTCTRAQAVTFIRNYAKDTSTDTTDKFTDVPADAWYAAPVAWAVKENVTAGMTPTTFVPGRTCTRAEMVTFIYNYAK